MKQAEAITEESFKITGRGVILELRHSEDGLPQGTELVSEKSGLTWKVRARVLFDHAVHEQKIFDSEFSEYMLMRFETPEKERKSIEEIKEREALGIYLYFLKPLGHEQKPQSGEKLIIKYP